MSKIHVIIIGAQGTGKTLIAEKVREFVQSKTFAAVNGRGARCLVVDSDEKLPSVAQIKNYDVVVQIELDGWGAAAPGKDKTTYHCHGCGMMGNADLKIQHLPGCPSVSHF